MRTIRTTLPLFTGYYSNEKYEPNFNRIIEDIEESRDLMGLKKMKITSDDLEFDYESYHRKLSKLICTDIESLCKEFIDSKITIQYNTFRTPNGTCQSDEIDCYLTFDEDMLMAVYNGTLAQMDGVELYQYKDDLDEIQKLSESYLDDAYISAITTFILKVNECSEPEMSDFEIDEAEYCDNIEYYTNLDEINLYHLRFSNQTDYDECLFWLRNWITEYKYIEHRDLLIVEFNESIWSRVYNDLMYSPLVNFKYEISCEYF